MLTLHFWAPVVASVFFLLFALVNWVRGQRRRSLAYRWFSVVYVAVALCAGFAAVTWLVTPRVSDLWLDLEFAALFLAVCALVVACVYAIRENRRGAAMPR
jgi:hypothetical protein